MNAPLRVRAPAKRGELAIVEIPPCVPLPSKGRDEWSSFCIAEVRGVAKDGLISSWAPIGAYIPFPASPHASWLIHAHQVNFDAIKRDMLSRVAANPHANRFSSFEQARKYVEGFKL